MVNGMYNEAEEEFEKCLTHRLALPSPHESRGVADAHVRRAQALFYASTLEGADKVGGLFPSGVSVSRIPILCRSTRPREWRGENVQISYTMFRPLKTSARA